MDVLDNMPGQLSSVAIALGKPFDIPLLRTGARVDRAERAGDEAADREYLIRVMPA